jgi:hypothetical protein
MEKIRLSKNLERIVAHLPELEEQMGDITYEKILLPARDNLARHHKTGAHKVTQTKGKVDHFVNLEGPASISVEEGHHAAHSGKWVKGLNILKDTLR